MIPFSLLLENVRQAKDYLAKLNIDPATNKDYQAIRTMLNGNDGYTFWFVKQHFGNKSTLEELQNVWSICQQERATIAKFSKPLVNLENIEEFWDEYYKQKNLSKARSAYNKFMREQRGYLDFTKEEDRKLLEDLADRKDADENFYNKSQRYHTRKDLINAIRIFLESRSDSNFGRLLNSLEQDGQDIRYFSQENNIIIICVDYNSLKKWGGDTSWCIVPSKQTFDSYNIGTLPQQFIIFLTNESGNRSKIGVTTNIDGYRTAHFKNDSYCRLEELSTILKERGTRFGILLPNKDLLMEFPNWNKFPVKSLKQIGFTTEEILAKKELFNTEGTRGDLEYFTQEEIDKNNLLEKTTLYPNDLKSFSSKEIDKRNLWKRLSVNSLAELISLKLEYPLLKKIAVYKTQKGESLSNDFMANFIANTTNRKSVISAMKRSHWVSYTKDGRIYSVESSQAESTKLDLFDLLQLTEEEWDNKNLYELVRKGQGRDSSGITNIKRSVTDMESRGRVVDDALLLIIVNNNIHNDGWIKMLCSLISDRFRTDWALQKLNALIEGGQEEIPSHRHYNYDSNLRQFELNYSDLKEIKKKIAGYEDIYDNIFNLTKSYLYASYNQDKFKIKSEDRNRWRDVNIEATLSNLDFFSVKLPLKNFFGLFNWSGVSNLSKLLKYLKDSGYDLSNEEELIEGVDTLSNSNDDQVDRLITMIECGVAVKTNYDSLIKWVEDRRKPISSYTKTKLENVFNKKAEYYKKWQNLHSLDAINEALSSALSTTDYWSGTDRDLKLKPEQWFDKYWDTLKDYSWEDQYEKRQDYDQKYFNAVIQLLAKLGKKKELMGLKNDRLIQGDGYGQTGLKKLCQIIAEKDVTNGSRTYREMKLSLDERKMIFDWLNKQVDEKTKDGSGWGHIYSIMAIVWYLFDKDKFWRYVDSVTTLKNNVHEYEWKNEIRKIKKSSTVRLYELKKVLPFLAEEGYWDDLVKILKMFSSLKMTKTEYKESVDSLYWAFFYNSRTAEDREKGEIRSRDLSSSVEKKYKELVTKYITPPEPKVKKVKESKIFSWKEFNI
jgi:hypothetical protein